MKKPLIHENRDDFNDLRNVYNPDKYSNSLGNYLQKNATKEVETVVKSVDKAVKSVDKAAKSVV